MKKGTLENKICIVNNGGEFKWGLIGGTIEKGESFEDTLKREIIEEGNLKVLKFEPLGYQIATDLDTGKWCIQLRYYVEAEKIGEFVRDPDNKVTEIKFINPKDVKEYFDWGKTGDAILKKAEDKYLESMKMNNHRKILPYTKKWKEEYEKEFELISGIFPENRMEHIGSTSITGLASKDIIDLALVFENESEAMKGIDKLEKLEYIFDRKSYEKYGSNERVVLRKGNPTHFHLSLCYKNEGGFLNRQILFRDYLRNSEDAKKEYQNLKIKLNEMDPDGYEKYISGKTDFIFSILEKAISNNKPIFSEKWIDIKTGKKYLFEYFDYDDFSVLDKNKVTQCRAVAYVDGKICVVKNGKKNSWGLPGGTIENGESYKQCLDRELQEEANLKIISYKSLFYQKAIDLETGKFKYQLRYFVIAEKIGEFVSDPAGTVTEVKFIDWKEYKNFEIWNDVKDIVFEKAEKFYKDSLPNMI
jgi:GrpB-like predicted nucleotidyltransferase (UPF0157 family)/8-oxo-dGTP pyrophosphatase MutT (NUDIX family)